MIAFLSRRPGLTLCTKKEETKDFEGNLELENGVWIVRKSTPLQYPRIVRARTITLDVFSIQSRGYLISLACDNANGRHRRRENLKANKSLPSSSTTSTSVSLFGLALSLLSNRPVLESVTYTSTNNPAPVSQPSGLAFNIASLKRKFEGHASKRHDSKYWLKRRVQDIRLEGLRVRMDMERLTKKMENLDEEERWEVISALLGCNSFSKVIL
ncbi:hypothetical protein MMC28_010824 [Mycoblastus sanguinarius]|nr:hypothetical protein [Mycoblastus sanguinarius]